MKKLIIANWKMNPENLDQARRIFQGVEHRMHFFQDKTEVVVCPPYIFLPGLTHHAHYTKLGAQNLHWQDTGAFTGEVSAKQLSAWSLGYAILGHSERRIQFGESDENVRLKIKAAIKHRIVPVVCLGGDAKASQNNMKRLTTKQFNAAVKGLDKKQIEKIIFVYEPTWAISTMKNAEPATGEHAADLIMHIRQLSAKHVGVTRSAGMHILYGGSVNKANVHEFAKHPTIDGALIGAASLEPDNFVSVIKEFHRESIHKA
jgi:triosephosphate isomerase (TIM)